MFSILFIAILCLFYYSTNINCTCALNTGCFNIYDGRSDKYRSTYENKILMFSTMVFHLGRNGVAKFVRRGFDFAKDLATNINIDKIEDDINLGFITIHYKITNLQLQEFDVLDFDYTLPVEEGENEGIGYLNNGEITIIANLEWATKSWPPLEDHYFTEIAVKKFGLQASVTIDSPGFDTKEWTEQCPYHIFFTTKGSSITLGSIKVDLKNEDGSGSALAAIINLLLPAFVKVLEEQLGEIFIDQVFKIASEAIWVCKNFSRIQNDLNVRLATDNTITQIFMSQKGVMATMGGIYYIRTNNDQIDPATGCDSVGSLYLPDILLPEKNPDVYKIVPTHPSSADMSVTYHKELINSFFYQVAKNNMAYLNNKITTKENCKICSDSKFKSVVDEMFNTVPEYVLNQNIQIFDEDQYEAYDNFITYPNDYEIGYAITRNHEKEINEYDFPKIIDIGAKGLLGEGKVKIDIYIINKNSPEDKVLMMTIDNPMQFVLQPYTEFIGSKGTGDSLPANVTNTYFNYLPYGFKNNQNKLSMMDLESSDNIFEDTHRKMEDFEIVSLVAEDNILRGNTNDSLSYLIALIQKNIIAIYLTNYFHDHSIYLISPNIPMYLPDNDNTYYTYKKDCMIWNCEFSS